MMHAIAEEQKRRNLQSRGSWERYRHHRQRVNQLLMEAADARGSLCLLGAGNSNDVDLKELLTGYQQIHLVDLDGEALAHGAEARHCQSDRVQLHGEIDLSFVAHLLPRTPSAAPDDHTLDECVRIARSDPPLDLPTFDTVSSVCLLTQLLESVELFLGAGHPRCLELKMEIRACHLRLLMRLLRPGGTAVLLLDFVSSATFPGLSAVPEPRLMDTAAKLIAGRNFFTGVNPFVIGNWLQTDPAIAPLVQQVRISKPWLWDFGPRSYLVCAVVVGRH